MPNPSPILACAFVLAGALAPSAAGQNPPDENVVRVMSFNIRYGTADDGENAWPLRRDLVANAILAYRPHILGTQECLDFQADYLAARLEGYERFGIGRNPDGTGERMQVFYDRSRLTPVAIGHFWLSETPEVPGSRGWDAANRRMASWARFHDRETRAFFYFLNTHFDHRSKLARRQAARMLAQWAESLPPGANVIVTGDFNATAESSEPWNTLSSIMNDSWIAAETRKGPAITWSGFKPPQNSVNRIDWILFKGDFDVTLCETVLYNENGRYPSDHFPVFAEFIYQRNNE